MEKIEAEVEVEPRVNVVFRVVDGQWVNVLLVSAMKSLVIVSLENTLDEGDEIK